MLSLVARATSHCYHRHTYYDLRNLRTVQNISFGYFQELLAKGQIKSFSKPRLSQKNQLFHTPRLSQENLLFHTSSSKSALPPVILILLRPITKFVAVAFGRSIRVWWKNLPEIERKSLILSVRRRKYIFLACLVPIVAGGVFFYASHIDENPITKRKRFIAFSHEQMVQLADIEQKVITEDYKTNIVPATHPFYLRVVSVVHQLLNANQDIEGINDHEWRVIIVDKPDIPNAFILPNGTIFMFTGMLQMCNNDNELGIVLAHEMSHTILRHTAEQVSNVHLIEFLLFFPVVLIWALLPDLGAVLAQFLSGFVAKMVLHLPFSRQTEMEADDVGLTLAAKACFDVREASCFWKKIKALMEEEEIVEWLSTHPSYETRQIVLDGLIPSALKLRDSCQCPKLSPYDPRSGIDSVIKKMDRERKKGQLVLAAHPQS